MLPFPLLTVCKFYSLEAENMAFWKYADYRRALSQYDLYHASVIYKDRSKPQTKLANSLTTNLLIPFQKLNVNHISIRNIS